MSKYRDWTDEDLSRFVPDVYQKSIHSIDYQKLKSKGIKLISFDIDDTIEALEKYGPSKEAIGTFAKLKNMGFVVVLLSNARYERVKRYAEVLEVNNFIAEAQKPRQVNFEKILHDYGVDKTQMAHVGNSMRDDIQGGNLCGITTCLVRRVGKSVKVYKAARNMVHWGGTEGHKIREELENRGIWCKHHKYEEGDQYYQIGEVQNCSPNFKLFEY